MKKTKPTHRPAFPNTRKALRKEKRQQKKKNRLEHYSKKKEERTPIFTPGRFVMRPADAEDTSKEPKAKKVKQQHSIQDVLIRQFQKEKNDEERLKAQMEKQRKMILLKANEEEDKVIKKLEKQLGLKKSKNKNNFFADDGLDYLLEICDRATTEQIVAAEKHLADVEGDSDFEEDLAAVTGKELSNKKDKPNKKAGKNDDSDNSEVESEIDDEISNDNESLSGESNPDEDLSENDYSMGEDDDEISENSDIEKNTVNSKDKKKSDVTSKEQLSDESDVEEKPIDKSNSKKKQSNQELNVKINNKESKEKNTVNNKDKLISEEDLGNVFSDDEVSHLSGDDDLDEFSSQHSGDEHGKAQQDEKPDVWEDIYGRKRDKEGNIIKEVKGTYIPPHLRNKESSSDKELAQLKRQIKSVLNKLSGTNLHWACTSIENLYSNNSRNSVNTALTQLWLEATVGPAITPDRMVAEHAALVSVLHANVGSEIGAHFLQELCKRFDAMMLTPQPVEDKRLDNLVCCLAHLYNFKIYHSSLVYDILSRLSASLSEKHIECVLLALRCVGGVLRRDDPAALRAFIHTAQGNVAHIQNADTGSRVKFLMEVLLAVKNNNLAKIPQYDPGYVEQLRKACRGVVRRGNYGTTLNIRLEDLLKAEERGKWWVVGSAWEGSRVVEATPAVPPGGGRLVAPAGAGADQKLLELARKQRMNTDVRRSIFCVIMSAEDYMDAFEKLQQLGLRGQQRREVVHVLLACCLQERTYNPYYAVLAQKLCDHDRKDQLAIQYAVWDKVKELDGMPRAAAGNLAQLLVHLILGKGQPLSILKIIQFSDLNKKTVRFMRQILLAIIMNADLQAALEVFHRISKPPKLHMFRESLRLFIQHFLIKNAGKKTSVLSDDEMATLRERTLQVDRILTTYDSKLRL